MKAGLCRNDTLLKSFSTGGFVTRCDCFKLKPSWFCRTLSCSWALCPHWLIQVKDQPVQDVRQGLEMREGSGQINELVVSTGLLNCCCQVWSCSTEEPAVSLGSAVPLAELPGPVCSPNPNCSQGVPWKCATSLELSSVNTATTGMWALLQPPCQPEAVTTGTWSRLSMVYDAWKVIFLPIPTEQVLVQVLPSVFSLPRCHKL